MFDITKHITENNDALNEVGCQGCGWNTEPDREKYCKTCDPSGDREANRKKSDLSEGAERNWTQYGPGDWSIEASEVKGGGGSRSVLLPGIGKPISFLKWKEKKDSEGEVQAWTAQASRYRYTIWND